MFKRDCAYFYIPSNGAHLFNGVCVALENTPCSHTDGAAFVAELGGIRHLQSPIRSRDSQNVRYQHVCLAFLSISRLVISASRSCIVQLHHNTTQHNTLPSTSQHNTTHHPSLHITTQQHNTLPSTSYLLWQAIVSVANSFRLSMETDQANQMTWGLVSWYSLDESEALTFLTFYCSPNLRPVLHHQPLYKTVEVGSWGCVRKRANSNPSCVADCCCPGYHDVFCHQAS